MVFKWKDDHTPLILNLMQNRPCLWNTKVEDYKRKPKREAALMEVLKELHLPNEVTVDDLRAKIKTIRTRYSSELAKVKYTSRSRSESQEVYVPKLFWFEQADSFLRDVCVPRKIIGSAITKRKRSATPETIKTEDIHSEENENAAESVTTATKELISTDAKRSKQGVQQEQQQRNSSQEPQQSKNNKGTKTRMNLKPPTSTGNRNSGCSVIARAIHKLGEIAVQNRVRADTESEFDHFGKSIAIQLKKMPVDRALICQQKVQKVITEERLRQLRTEVVATSLPYPETLSSHDEVSNSS